MMAWGLFLAFVIGIGVGYIGALVQAIRNEDKAARERATRRAVLGLPERDATQEGARGTAVVHDAEYRERDAEHGMDM